MAKSSRNVAVTQKLAATDVRTFRSFLLMQQFEAAQIAARIKQARNECGLTQDQVADIATFSKRSLQDYENGVTLPWRHLKELGRLYNRQPEWFLHGDPETSEDGDVRLDRLEARLNEVLRLVQQLRDELLEPHEAARAK